MKGILQSEVKVFVGIYDKRGVINGDTIEHPTKATKVYTHSNYGYKPGVDSLNLTAFAATQPHNRFRHTHLTDEKYFI